jgi:hypothetical protein
MMTPEKLTPVQEAAAQRIAETIAQRAKEESLPSPRLLVSKRDEEWLGKTELEIRG